MAKTKWLRPFGMTIRQLCFVDFVSSGWGSTDGDRDDRLSCSLLRVVGASAVFNAGDADGLSMVVW